MKKYINLAGIAIVLITVLIACNKSQESLTPVPVGVGASAGVLKGAKVKVTVCHKLGNGNFMPLEVSPDAVPAHLGHGDYLCDADEDGYSATGACSGTQNDCDDNNAAINPGATEIKDGIDNDCDGLVDEGFEDPDPIR